MMKKYISYKIIGLALLVLGIVACETADQDVSPVISPDGYPVATFTNETGNSVTEGDTIFYTITIDKMLERALTFSLNQTGGTATEDNYTCDAVVLAPYTKSVQLMIITYKDYDPTPSWTIEGEIGVFGIAEKYLLNPSTVNPIVSFTINNFVSPDLEVEFYWDQEVLIDGDPYDAADYIDFDFLVSEAEGFDINDPWATEIGIYDAATGDHPEKLVLSGLDDGDYILWADLYWSGFAGESNDSSLIAITTVFNRQGTSLMDLEVLQDESQRMVADQAGYDNDPTGVYDGICAKVTVAAGKYTIIGFDGTTLGTWKASAVRAKRPANIPRK
jgi:hypothetical protein